MECYAIPWQIWRAAIYCGTFWLPLPALFLSLFLNFAFGLACLFGWMFDSARCSQGVAIKGLSSLIQAAKRRVLKITFPLTCINS